MIDQKLESVTQEKRTFLPLGSVVILNGSVKKLLIVSRGSIVEGSFFDYGAFLFPEGMIDSNIAYFDQGDILKVVFEGYSDTDDELVLEILNDAYSRFHENGESARTPAAPPAPVVAVSSDDPFAGVRDLGDDDE